MGSICGNDFHIFRTGADMEKAKTPYEKASQELNEFRERRVAERRSRPRGTPDRRKNGNHQWLPQDEDLPDRKLH